MLKRNRVLALSIMLVVILSIILSSCQPAVPAKDDSKGPIKIGNITDLTGPIALAGVPAYESQSDWWEYYNAKYGGIKGHPVELVTVDTKFDNNLAVSGFEKLVNQDKVHWVSVLAASFMPSISPLANKYKVCTAGPSEMTVLLPLSASTYIFGNGGTMSDYYRSSLNWVKDNWKKADPPRIGILGCDISYSKTVVKTVKWMLENEFHWPVVAEEWQTMSATSAVTQVTNLKNANCDYIIMASQARPEIIFLKTAEPMGLTSSTKFIDTWLTGMPAIRRLIPESLSGIINHVPVAIYPQMSDDAPVLKTIAEIHQKKRPNVELDWVRISAYSQAIGFISIFEQAIDKYGYSNLTGENIKWICENKMQGNTSQGLAAPITWSSTNHVGSHDTSIVETTKDTSLNILYKWYKMPAWPKAADDISFWE